jgi:hypothetical protein
MRMAATPDMLGDPAPERIHKVSVDFTMTLAHDAELHCVYVYDRWEHILYIRP